MKIPKNTDIALLLIGLFLYFGYLIIAVFVLRRGYEYGLYLFSPLYLYTLGRVLSARIKKMSFLLAVHLTIPFFASVYLSFIGAAPVWEVSGFLPLPLLLSFSFKSEKSSSPLFTSLLLPVYAIFFGLLSFFTVVNYLSHRSVVSSLQLTISLYSPAIVASTTVVFFRLILETAALNLVLNDFRLFIHGARIRRLIFDSPRFLSLAQAHFAGIITAEGVSREEFLKKVNALNKEFSSSSENSDIMRRDAKFSRTMSDGTELTLGTLYLLLKKERFSAERLALPPNFETKSYVALAENRRILGYYIVEKFEPAANKTMIAVLKERYGIETVIIGDGNDMFPGTTRVSSLSEIMLSHEDLLITETPPDRPLPCIVALWGAQRSDACDLFIVEPALLNIMKLMSVLNTVRPRLYRSVAVTSLPLLLPLFLSIYGINLPQINAIAIMFLMVLTITQAFRSVKND